MNVTFDLFCKFILKQSDKSLWQNYLVMNWKQSTCSSVGFGYIMVYNGDYEVHTSDYTSETAFLLVLTKC